MYFEIHAEIASVRIRKQVRADGRMIQGGIENGFIFFIGSGDVYFRQIIVPGSAGVFSYLVEVPFGNFGFHILACAGDIDSRYTHFYQYFFVFLCIEVQHRFAYRQALAVVHCDRIGDEGICERFGELGVEVNVLVESPVSRLLVSADFRVADYFDFHLVVGLPLQAVVQVDDKSGFCAFGESVAVDGAAFGSCDFRFYLIGVEEDGVISGFRSLILVRESRGVSQFLAFRISCQILRFADNRHQ